MKNPRRNYCLRVRGPAAAFRCPEALSATLCCDLIPPATARAIFSAVFWKPAVRWHVTAIEVLKPIRAIVVNRPDTGLPPFPRLNVPLRRRPEIQLVDVAYRLHADLEYLPPEMRSGEKSIESDGPETAMKYFAMFERLAAAGRYFACPYLGRAEFPADCEFIPRRELAGERAANPALNESFDRDFGLMFYDMDYYGTTPDRRPLFYRPRMRGGIIEVPEHDSPEVIGISQG